MYHLFGNLFGTQLFQIEFKVKFYFTKVVFYAILSYVAKVKFHFFHILLNCIELNFNKIEFHVRTHF